MSRSGLFLAVFTLAALCANGSFASEATEAASTIDLAVLTASSRLAADHSGNPAVVAYADREAASQETFAVRPAMVARAEVARVELGADAVQTGRSVAVAQSGHATDEESGVVAATAGLVTLNSLHGAAFDRLYKVLQRDTLLHIEDSYLRLALSSGNETLVEAARQRCAKVLERITKATSLPR